MSEVEFLEEEFFRLVSNALGLPLLAVFSFAVGIATLVLGVVHGLSWTDMHKAANKDPGLRNKVFWFGVSSIFYFSSSR
jgi:hypothetical protein